MELRNLEIFRDFYGQLILCLTIRKGKVGQKQKGKTERKKRSERKQKRRKENLKASNKIGKKVERK